MSCRVTAEVSRLRLGLLCLRPKGHFGIARSVRLSVPWRSCLGYRHAGCLQLSHRRPPEMCGLRTRPRTDVDPPRFLPPSNCHRRGNIVSPSPRRCLVRVSGGALGLRPVHSTWTELEFANSGINIRIRIHATEQQPRSQSSRDADERIINERAV